MPRWMQEGELSILRSPRIPFAGGVNRDIDPEHLKDGESSDVKNFILRRGTAHVRRGIKEYEEFSTYVPTRDWPCNGLYSFEFEDGQRFLLVIMSYKTKEGYVYQYNGSGWTDISGSPVPTIGSADPDNPWDFTFGIDADVYASPGGACYFVNGTKRIFYWDGVGDVKDASTHSAWDPPSGITYVSGRYIMTFGGRLFLAYVNENGGTKPLRVRYSDVNHFLVFNTANGGHVVDLAETSGAITGMWAMGEKIYVAKEDAIIVGVETGDPSVPIAWPTYINTGCMNGRSFQAIAENVGIFLGNDNVYMITEGSTKKIGDPVRDDILGSIDYNKVRSSVHSAVDTVLGLYYLWVDNKHCFIYNWVEDSWSKEYYPGSIYYATTSYTRSTTYIDSVSTIIDDDDTTIDDYIGAVQRGDIVVSVKYKELDHRVGYLSSVNNDFGENPQEITTYIDSKDFIPNSSGWATLKCVELTYSSTDEAKVSCEISTNKGSSWEYSNTAVLPKSTGGATHRFYFNVYGQIFRVRFIVYPDTGSAEESGSVFPIDLHTYVLEFTARGAARR